MMFKRRDSIRSIVLLLPLFLVASHSFPSGAGGCSEGQAAVGGSHLTRQHEITEELATGHITVELNGEALSRNETVVISQGVDNMLHLRGQFLGFLVRLGNGSEEGTDTREALSPADANGQVARAACVLAEQVGGVTHVNNMFKTSAHVVLRMDQVAEHLPLDITVVVANRNLWEVGHSLSVYYHTTFSVTVVTPTPEPGRYSEDR